MVMNQNNSEVVVGIYGDEVPGMNTVQEIVSYFKNKGIKVSDVSGDMDYGWEMTLTGTPKTLFFAVCNVIPGYDCDSVKDFIDEYRIDEAKKISQITNKILDGEDIRKVLTR